MRASGHIPAGMTASQCVELGFDEIQHVNFLILNFFPEIKNTNTIARLVEPAKLGASLDLTSPQVQSFVKLLQDHHTKLDLTLSIFEDSYLSRAGQIPIGFQPIANRLPAQVRRGLLSAGMTPPPGMDETYRKSFAKMMDLASLLYRAGIQIEAGTDSMAGFALHRELELDAQAGIPPAQVLQNATLNAARIMSLDKDLGSIAQGKLADVVLIDGDPTVNISNIRKTALVVKDGVIYKPAELYSELGVKP
jgi:imidazolonepropionase-like amidohydrolase